MHDLEFKESAYFNNTQYGIYLQYIAELAISQFEYKNLPDTVDPRFIEMCLFFRGRAVFFKDEVLGFLCLNCSPRDGFNVYGIPKEREAIAVNGYHKELDNENSVIIYNNYLRLSTFPEARYYSRQLYNMDRIISVNINAQKTPVIVVCDEKQRLTFENLIKKYDGNEPFIWGNKTLGDKPLTVLSTGAPFISKELFTLRQNYLADVLTRLGIDNNKEKKERMIVGELDVSRGETLAARYSRLDMRKYCIDKINKMFDLNIEVDFKRNDEYEEMKNINNLEVEE